MPEYACSSYQLYPAVLESWLRAKFEDPTLAVEDDYEEIYRLRGRRGWSTELRPPVRPAKTPVPVRSVPPRLATSTQSQNLQPLPTGMMLDETFFQQSIVDNEVLVGGTSPQPPERKVTVDMKASQVASKLLVERFLKDDHLLDLYQEAVKRLDRKCFINNHTTLLKRYFLNLRAAVKSRTEEISVDFLRSRRERIRMSSVIYDLILKQGEQVRQIVKMEIKDNQESILLVDRFLAKQEGYDQEDTTYLDSESSDSSDESSSLQEQTSQGESSKLEAVATFMTVGSAFESYKYNLDEFLHPRKRGDKDPSIILAETSPTALTTSQYARKIARGFSWLMKITRPRVKKVYRRLEWTCDCGSQLYADFIVLDEEKFQQFVELLQGPPPVGSQGGIANAPSSQGSSSAKSGSPNSNQDSPNTSSHPMSSNTVRPPGADTPSKVALPPGSGRGQRDYSTESPESKSKYLAICVQTGPIYTTLEEVDTSSFTTDATLLKQMKSVYTRIRGMRTKYNSFFIPVGLEFVKFSLWNQKHGYVSICDRSDSVPPKTRLEYDYDPKPLDFLPPMPAQVFLHYLEHGEDGWNKLRYLWLPKIPVRRKKRIIEGDEASYGWGIHIIEGLNRWAIFIIFLITLFGSALAAILCRVRDRVLEEIQSLVFLDEVIQFPQSGISSLSLLNIGKKDRLSSIMVSISTRADKPPDFMEFPGLMEARSKIGEIHGRDQFSISFYYLDRD
ncbi:unnamed protein product [Fusarium graminearum]|nr:unnamed protein product [Fusarium graminearum]